jgi:acetyl esterase/lipase
VLLNVIGSSLMCASVSAQQEIKLYPDGSTESNGIAVEESFQRADFVIDISIPRMYFYPAAKENNTGMAILICPGGGYAGVSIDNEGKLVAKWFTDLGVSAFVLYYRMPNGHTEIPLKDAQTALRIIREGAKKWGVDKNKIGIMGFSAGGHLASTVGTHFQTKLQRPDFMILLYPVVTMKNELTHLGSRENLLGKNPAAEVVSLYSNELQVAINTPPTFIVHALDDKAVPVENSKQLLKAMQDKQVPAELHTFDIGGHGFGMRKQGIPADSWPDLLNTWLKSNKLIN